MSKWLCNDKTYTCAKNKQGSFPLEKLCKVYCNPVNVDFQKCMCNRQYAGEQNVKKSRDFCKKKDPNISSDGNISLSITHEDIRRRLEAACNQNSECKDDEYCDKISYSISDYIL